MQGCIAVACASSPPLTAPFGGCRARFGTNPLAVGVPRAAGRPLVLDFGTSALSFYRLLALQRAGAPLPDGAGFDRDGRATRDADAVLDGGALAAFDYAAPHSAVGGALALLVELFAGAAVGAGIDIDLHKTSEFVF